jgi:hypothetical protein
MLQGCFVWLLPLSLLFSMFHFCPQVMNNSCLSFPGLAYAVSSLRWYARTAGSMLRGISFQMEALF